MTGVIKNWDLECNPLSHEPILTRSLLPALPALEVSRCLSQPRQGLNVCSIRRQKVSSGRIVRLRPNRSIQTRPEGEPVACVYKHSTPDGVGKVIGRSGVSVAVWGSTYTYT